MKLMFDCYHVGCAEGEVIPRLRALYDRVGHIQVAAVPTRAEPDEGKLDYAAVFAEIDRLGWPGWVGAEYRPRTTTDAGLGWLGTLAGSRRSPGQACGRPFRRPASRAALPGAHRIERPDEHQDVQREVVADHPQPRTAPGTRRSRPHPHPQPRREQEPDHHRTACRDAELRTLSP